MRPNRPVLLTIVNALALRSRLIRPTGIGVDRINSLPAGIYVGFADRRATSSIEVEDPGLDRASANIGSALAEISSQLRHGLPAGETGIGMRRSMMRNRRRFAVMKTVAIGLVGLFGGQFGCNSGPSGMSCAGGYPDFFAVPGRREPTRSSFDRLRDFVEQDDRRGR